jgi:membrane protein YdbS with pleckstrin-like domain
VKLIHIVFATVGLAVIVGVMVWAVSAVWVTLVALMALAAVAGLLTRFAIPREQRLRMLERLNRSAAQHIRDR